MIKLGKYILFFLFGSVVLLLGILTILYSSADMGELNVEIDMNNYVIADSGSYSSCNGNFLRKNSKGLWEAYIHGDAMERGVAFGVLSKDLLYYQENVFVNQIREMVPSDNYLKFLRFLTVIFNRKLGEYVPDEYCREIYGISLSCTHEYDAIGTSYERQLNYHAAHDIGHAMQEYMLVGCSSFAVWNDKSADSTLLIGRNFDFYVGDDFAQNRLIMFVEPDSGYRFVSVGWAGMIGVLSGMNERGLTVTINAAKGSLPISGALPISILAREILQYASDIDEAYRIAEKRQTFVSESLLIGSVKDGRAAVIEKTPSEIGLFNGTSNQIISTNHYQSEGLRNNTYNLENVKNTDSPYRYKRIEQLLNNSVCIAPCDAARILRDRKGLKGEDIGLANEKSINQSIAHHSVIFKPQQGLMWVSTAPWQSGEYICYDIHKIFRAKKMDGDMFESECSISADSVFILNDYPNVTAYRTLTKQIKQCIKNGITVTKDSIERFVTVNPNMYYVYELLGDYYKICEADDNNAELMWKKALTKEIPKVAERKKIVGKLKKIKDE